MQDTHTHTLHNYKHRSVHVNSPDTHRRGVEVLHQSDNVRTTWHGRWYSSCGRRCCRCRCRLLLLLLLQLLLLQLLLVQQRLLLLQQLLLALRLVLSLQLLLPGQLGLLLRQLGLLLLQQRLLLCRGSGCCCGRLLLLLLLLLQQQRLLLLLLLLHINSGCGWWHGSRVLWYRRGDGSARRRHDVRRRQRSNTDVTRAGLRRWRSRLRQTTLPSQHHPKRQRDNDVNDQTDGPRSSFGTRRQETPTNRGKTGIVAGGCTCVSV